MSDPRSLAISKLGSAKAILLDYDGLLVDTESVYLRTWGEVLDAEGRRLCAGYHCGRHQSEVFEVVRAHVLPPFSGLDEVSAYRQRAFRRIINTEGICLMPGWADLLPVLLARCPVYVVSNSSSDDVEWGLGQAGFDGGLSGIFGYLPGAKRKPDPFLYDCARRQLGIDAADLVAFEDSTAGLLAAQAAGIPVICISQDDEAVEFAARRQIAHFESARAVLERSGFGLSRGAGSVPGETPASAPVENEHLIGERGRPIDCPGG